MARVTYCCRICGLRIYGVTAPDGTIRAYDRSGAAANVEPVSVICASCAAIVRDRVDNERTTR